MSSDIVTLVFNVGIGDDTYRVLEPGEEHQTSGGIDHYAHVVSTTRERVSEEVERIGERYVIDFTRVGADE